MGQFIIKQRSNGEYQFNLKASNGQIILTSEGYSSKDGCRKGIEAVKENASLDQRYERLTAANGYFYFNLKAANGQIVGTSEMYTSEGGRNGGIEAVKTNAVAASLVDYTI